MEGSAGGSGGGAHPPGGGPRPPFAAGDDDADSIPPLGPRDDSSTSSFGSSAGGGGDGPDGGRPMPPLVRRADSSEDADGGGVEDGEDSSLPPLGPPAGSGRDLTAAAAEALGLPPPGAAADPPPPRPPPGGNRRPDPDSDDDEDGGGGGGRPRRLNDVISRLFIQSVLGGLDADGGPNPLEVLGGALGLGGLGLGGGPGGGGGGPGGPDLFQLFSEPPRDVRRPDQLVCPTCMKVHRPVAGSARLRIPPPDDGDDDEEVVNIPRRPDLDSDGDAPPDLAGRDSDSEEMPPLVDLDPPAPRGAGAASGADAAAVAGPQSDSEELPPLVDLDPPSPRGAGGAGASPPPAAVAAPQAGPPEVAGPRVRAFLRGISGSRRPDPEGEAPVPPAESPSAGSGGGGVDDLESEETPPPPPPAPRPPTRPGRRLETVPVDPAGFHEEADAMRRRALSFFGEAGPPSPERGVPARRVGSPAPSSAESEDEEEEGGRSSTDEFDPPSDESTDGDILSTSEEDIDNENEETSAEGSGGDGADGPLAEARRDLTAARDEVLAMLSFAEGRGAGPAYATGHEASRRLAEVVAMYRTVAERARADVDALLEEHQYLFLNSTGELGPDAFTGLLARARSLRAEIQFRSIGTETAVRDLEGRILSLARSDGPPGPELVADLEHLENRVRALHASSEAPLAALEGREAAARARLAAQEGREAAGRARLVAQEAAEVAEGIDRSRASRPGGEDTVAGEEGEAGEPAAEVPREAAMMPAGPAGRMPASAFAAFARGRINFLVDREDEELSDGGIRNRDVRQSLERLRDASEMLHASIERLPAAERGLDSSVQSLVRAGVPDPERIVSLQGDLQLVRTLRAEARDLEARLLSLLQSAVPDPGLVFPLEMEVRAMHEASSGLSNPVRAAHVRLNEIIGMLHASREQVRAAVEGLGDRLRSFERSGVVDPERLASLRAESRALQTNAEAIQASQEMARNLEDQLAPLLASDDPDLELFAALEARVQRLHDLARTSSVRRDLHEAIMQVSEIAAMHSTSMERVELGIEDMNARLNSLLHGDGDPDLERVVALQAELRALPAEAQRLRDAQAEVRDLSERLGAVVRSDDLDPGLVASLGAEVRSLYDSTRARMAAGASGVDRDRAEVPAADADPPAADAPPPVADADADAPPALEEDAEWVDDAGLSARIREAAARQVEGIRPGAALPDGVRLDFAAAYPDPDNEGMMRVPAAIRVNLDDLVGIPPAGGGDAPRRVDGAGEAMPALVPGGEGSDSSHSAAGGPVHGSSESSLEESLESLPPLVRRNEESASESDTSLSMPSLAERARRIGRLGGAAPTDGEGRGAAAEDGSEGRASAEEARPRASLERARSARASRLRLGRLVGGDREDGEDSSDQDNGGMGAFFSQLLEGRFDRLRQRREEQQGAGGGGGVAASPTNPLSHLRDYDARRVYANATCPICLEDDVNPIVALPCGHPMCEDCFRQLGGYLGCDKDKLVASEGMTEVDPDEDDGDDGAEGPLQVGRRRTRSRDLDDEADGMRGNSWAYGLGRDSDTSSVRRELWSVTENNLTREETYPIGTRVYPEMRGGVIVHKKVEGTDAWPVVFKSLNGEEERYNIPSGASQIVPDGRGGVYFLEPHGTSPDLATVSYQDSFYSAVAAVPSSSQLYYNGAGKVWAYVDREGNEIDEDGHGALSDGLWLVGPRPGSPQRIGETNSGCSDGYADTDGNGGLWYIEEVGDSGDRICHVRPGGAVEHIPLWFESGTSVIGCNSSSGVFVTVPYETHDDDSYFPQVQLEWVCKRGGEWERSALGDFPKDAKFSSDGSTRGLWAIAVDDENDEQTIWKVDREGRLDNMHSWPLPFRTTVMLSG